MRRSAAVLLAALCVAVPSAAHDAHEADAPVPAAGPSFPLGLPEPGTYELPPMGQVTPRTLLDHRGAPALVPDVPAGGAAILSLVYTHCPSGSGCPLALAVLQRLDRRIAADSGLADRVRTFTVSFDPARDDPARMAALRAGLAPRSDWRFLTASHPAELEPLLEELGQDVVPLRTAAGADTGLLRHVLKVFLLDDRGRVRNVYSSGFLSDEVLIRDLRTLLLESGAAAAPGHAAGAARRASGGADEIHALPPPHAGEE